MNQEFENASKELIRAGDLFYSRGWVPATSGNLSYKLSDGNIAITVSGKHKGRLAAEDIMIVDSEGKSLSEKKPSAETLLHTQIYSYFPQAKSVLHPHTVNATILSRHKGDHIILEDYELLKAFPGIVTHECRVVVPMFKNNQNIPELALEVGEFLKNSKEVFGYLIEGHGFYTWGSSVEDCINKVEAFEFLFECQIKELLLGRL